MEWLRIDFEINSIPPAPHMYNIILPAKYIINIYTLLLQVELFYVTYYYYMYLQEKCLLNKKRN